MATIDLFGLLGKAKDLVLPFKDNYKQASKEIEDFTSMVGEYLKEKEVWEQLLRKYPLPQELARLKEAVRGLEKQIKAVHAMEDRCCCLKIWDKAWSPGKLIDDLRGVGEAFENIRKCLKKRLDDQRLVEEAANNIKAPFSFPRDEKYVPVVKTVEEVRTALKGDGSEGSRKVVLLHGASGEGKSTMAKYLALVYYRAKDASSSGSCRFSDGVVFISCTGMTKSDSLVLLRKLGADLGYSLEASSVRGVGSNEGVGSNGRDDAALKQIDVDNLKQKLISRLGGKSILIILDDVSDPHVIDDLMMQPEKSDVNYLITSQRSNIWSSDKIIPIQIGSPSTEEARQILANHIVGWGGKQFPPDVQGKVDTLIKQVHNHPLVIANLASRINSHNVSKLRKWDQLTKQLKNALEAAAEDPSVSNVTMMFNTRFELSAIASLTMAFEDISDKARSLLLLLALCTGQGVSENVLALWFNTLHDADMFSFENAFEDLKARSLITINETECHEWSICSIHDLRRLLAPEMYKDLVENIFEKLIGRVSEGSMGGREGLASSGGSDEYLAGALFFLYCDEKYYQNVPQEFELYVEIRDADSLDPYHRTRLNFVVAEKVKFMKTIGQLLRPSLEEACELEKTAHQHAKTVILRLVQSNKLEDYELSKLLELPGSKTFLTSCSALASVQVFHLDSPTSIPKTIRNLVDPLRKWADEPPVVVNDLLNCLKALDSCTDSTILATVEDLPIFVIKLLRWSLSNSLVTVACTLLGFLDRLYRYSFKSDRVQLAAAPEMLETLFGLLNSNFDLGQPLLEQASKTFRRLACSDLDIKVKTILLPDVLNTLVRVLPLDPISTLESLKELSWTPEWADSIASHPGALDEIFRLVTCTINSDAQIAALFCMGELVSFPSTRTIIKSKYPSAFRTIIQLLTRDASLLFLIAIFSVVEKDIFDSGSETSEIVLTYFLEKLDLLIHEDVNVTLRMVAVKVLFTLASTQSMRERLGAHPAHSGLLEQTFRFLTFSDTTVTVPFTDTVPFMEIVNNVVSGIFIEPEGMGRSQRMTFASAAVKMYTALMEDKNTESEVQRRAVKGLAIICRMSEYCSVAGSTGAEQSLLIHMKKDPTFYMSVEGAHIVKDILLERAQLTKVASSVFVSVGLEFYMTNLRAADEVNPTECIVQAIALFAYSKQIRQLLTDGDTLEHLLGHVTERASPLIITCVAQIIHRVCCTEYDEAQRMTLLTGTLKRYIALLCQGIPMELREAALESLLIFAPKEETQNFLSTDESALDLLLELVRENTSAQTLHRVAYLLQNILVKGPGQEEVRRITFMDRAVERFVELLTDGISIKVQAGALGGLGRLAFKEVSGEIRVAYPGALNQLTRFLRKVDYRDMLEEVCEMVELFSACRMDAEILQDMDGLRSYALQCFISAMEDEAKGNMQNLAAWCLARILQYETNRKLFASVFASSNGGLSGLVHRASQLSLYLMEAYTLIDPVKAGEKTLSSISALKGRCRARISLKQYKSALEDCGKAQKLLLENADNKLVGVDKLMGELERLLVMRGCIKVDVGDVEGALEDLHRVIKCVNQRTEWINEMSRKIWRHQRESDVQDCVMSLAIYLQERGIVKYLIFDYCGAMLDLNESLRVAKDPDDYEVLKNRGYVKFSLGDEDGARFDAQQANSIRFRRCKFPSLGFGCLGVRVVKYLEFVL